MIDRHKHIIKRQRLTQFEFDLTSDGVGRAGEGVQRDGVGGGIKQSVEPAAAWSPLWDAERPVFPLFDISRDLQPFLSAFDWV